MAILPQCYAFSVIDRQSSNAAQIWDLAIFRDQGRARGELAVLHHKFSAELFTTCIALLPEAPDRDQALGLLERLLETDAESASLFETDHVLLHYVLLVFGYSYWLGEALIHNPDLLRSLRKDLERTRERDDFRSSLAGFVAERDEDTSLQLARFKKREYVRILLRDLLGIATLAEVTAENSALADVLIEAALTQVEKQMQQRYAIVSVATPPLRFAVLALGKLGGNELNYSSDVDLLYLYDGEERPGSEISLREYFVRQAQLLTEMLSRATAEGPVFRIDLRLRPQGHEGETAVALQHARYYYAHAAQDWELQALIKARHVAGDSGLAREFVRAVQPRVYTPKINFSAIETAIHSRRKISEHHRRSLTVRKQPATVDVKLDRGGIRDIEFLVQCLQRVYGGEEQWLRSCGTLFSLQKLNDKGHISAADYQELSTAYVFLRVTEHRLQLQRGQQVHRLPASAAELEVLARSVASPERFQAAGLLQTLRERMGRVAAIYERIIHSQKQRERGESESATDSYYIGARELSFEQLMRRLKADSDVLHRAFSSDHLELLARKNLHRFLGAAMADAERYRMLLENPGAAGKALALFKTSDYLSDFLVRSPHLLPLLNDMSSHRLRTRLSGLGKSGRDLNESLALLRRKFRQESFAIGVKDVLSPAPVFASMQESTRLADEVIRWALQMVQGEQALAVFALGRLGTEEFDIASDADLLFVRAPDADEAAARVAAERLVHALSAYTKDGLLFAVDARLRPHGGEGELVVSALQLETYLAQEAQPWEALTYTKLRFVAGREDLKPLLLAPAWHQIVELAFRPGFPAAVREMRSRLEKSNKYPNSFKLAAGGFYDVDFIASYVMLAEANLVPGNTLERLEQLHEAGFLQTSRFEKLREAAVLYRTTDHAIRLVTGRARPELPAAEHHRCAVERLVKSILGSPKEGNLQAELQKTQREVREIFLSIVN
jgi:[glutamine synthetase] adenylyltransferase / [glutamine synthetase]-adenylyl-L-tyrosine phosphorylase